MKSALRTYSGLLQLRTATIAGLLQSQAGIAYALKMFLIVILIAGLGHWFALPALWQQPTLAEQLEEAAVTGKTEVFGGLHADGVAEGFGNHGGSLFIREGEPR